ncbi:MAG TPA: hypothetical protein VMT32_17835 [Bryobacteraceae bacterium]|nr:hypothetical protein [Bryobacteraceae bacterium]
MLRDNRISGEPADLVREVSAIVQEARARLTAPTVESLGSCRSLLEQAILAVEKLQKSLPSGSPWRDKDLAAALGALRTEIAGVQILLDGAATFYTGWTRLASSMASGYTADGNPAPAETSRRVLMEV